MSIINEALKKAQVKLDTKTQNTPPKEKVYLKNKNTLQEQEVKSSIVQKAESFTTQAPTEQQNQTPHTKKWVTFAIPAILLFFLVGGYLYLRSTSATTASSQAGKISLGNQPIANTSQNNKFVVNGIMTEGDKKIALINNEIYQIGDYVDGWKLIEIDIDSVQLLDKGNILTLKVRNLK